MILEKYLNNDLDNDRIYLNPGDVVLLKQNIPYKPKMIVVKKITSIFKHDTRRLDNRPILKGIKCMWFTTDGMYLEATFSTKDLQLIN